MRPNQRITALLLSLALLLCIPASPAQAGDDAKDKASDKGEEAADGTESKPAGGAISAERTDLITAQMKQAVIVHGTIAELNIFPKIGHAVLGFEEGAVAIFIRKENLDKHPDWDLKALVGKEVYVAGQVFLYNAKLEIVIVGPEQIADSPDGFDLAAVPLPETKKPAPKKSGPAAPGAIFPAKRDLPPGELKLEEAAVQTVAFYLKDTGMKFQDDPFGLPIDRLMPKLVTVNASVKKMEGIGPMQIAFPKPDESSKARIQAVVDQLAENYGKWPQDALVTIDVDFESRAFKDDPAALVIAALIHSLITGAELAPNLVLSADIAEDGSLTPAGGNPEAAVSNYEIIKAIAADAAEPVRLVSSGLGTEELNDLALDGDWDSLASVSVLSAANLKEALNLVFADASGELGQALAAFDQAQAVIKKNGVGMVKNAHVQQRVMTAGKAWPANTSAVFYVYFAQNKVPRSYSLPRTHQLISDLRNDVRFLNVSKPDDAREKFRELGEKIRTLRSIIHPDLATLIRAITDFESEASGAALRPRDGRAGERQAQDLKDSDAKVTAELDALAAKIAGVEPAAAEEK